MKSNPGSLTWNVGILTVSANAHSRGNDIYFLSDWDMEALLSLMINATVAGVIMRESP